MKVDSINKTIATAMHALSAHKKGFQVSSENMANAHDVAQPGQKPYTRKVITLVEGFDPKSKQRVPKAEVLATKGEPKKIYDPQHPYADKEGFIYKPNINPTKELANATMHREAINKLSLLHKVSHEILKSDLELLKD